MTSGSEVDDGFVRVDAPRCACAGMHKSVPRRDRPEAHVRFFANPCGSRECQGSLLCVGHHACVECIAAIRADKCKWGPGALAGADIELYGITSGGIR